MRVYEVTVRLAYREIEDRFYVKATTVEQALQRAQPRIESLDREYEPEKGWRVRSVLELGKLR